MSPTSSPPCLSVTIGHSCFFRDLTTQPTTVGSLRREFFLWRFFSVYWLHISTEVKPSLNLRSYKSLKISRLFGANAQDQSNISTLR